MNLDTEDYAWLAKDAYQDRPEYVGKKHITINGNLYKVIAYAATPTGFHATAYRPVGSNAIIIAYRGTDADIKHHTLTTFQDVAVDILMVADKSNAQEADARRFTQGVLDYAKQHDIPVDHVTVTGHSLGGTLAEIEAWRFGLHGQTFNAYGAADLGYGLPEGGAQIIDNVLAGDPVSASSRHFGQLRTFATTADIDSFRATGYLDGHQGISQALHALRLSDHGIDNFAPDHGASVLTADNEARARLHAPTIARFRADAKAARTDLQATTKLPFTPTWDLAREAETMETLSTTDRKVEAKAVRLGHAAIREGERAIHAVQHAGEAVAHDLERTGHALAREAHEVDQGIKHGFTSFQQALSGTTAPAPLSDPNHPDHTLFAQALAGVRTLDAEHGRATDQHSLNLAAALAVEAKREGLNRIDRVLLNDDASRTIAVQNLDSLWAPIKLASVDTMTALQTPMAQGAAHAAPVPPPQVATPVPAQTPPQPASTLAL